jgi:mRNA interferase RelE/StbE
MKQDTPGKTLRRQLKAITVIVNYEIVLSKSAVKEFKNIPSPIQSRIEKTIDLLESNPRPMESIKLTDKDNIFRIKVGNYRIVYEINYTERIVLITRIRHRKDAYRV